MGGRDEGLGRGRGWRRVMKRLLSGAGERDWRVDNYVGVQRLTLDDYVFTMGSWAHGY